MSSPPPDETLLAPGTRWHDGAISTLPDTVRRLGGQRVLLVCGRTSFEASGAARVLPELERVAQVHRFSDVRPNTDAQDLAVALDLLHEVEPDTIVGVGGGSAMDLAKLLIAYDDVPGTEVADAIRAGRAPNPQGDRRLVLAPTTSGSGAETTHFAVVYTGDKKHSIAGASLRPDATVLDPQLTLSASSYQRATSGIDAICQAIESLWAVGATDDSRRFARTALPHLLDAIEPFVTDGDAEAARQMAYGSHLGGRAIDVSKTTAAHALSYGITKRFGRSHGHAVATTLGPFLTLQAGAGTDDLDVELSTHRAAIEEILRLLGAADGPDATARWTALLERIGLDPRLTAAGEVDATVREELAAGANPDRLGNDPYHLTHQDLAAALTAAG